MAVYFKNYTKKDYNAVCDFLIELNRNDNSHINFCKDKHFTFYWKG